MIQMILNEDDSRQKSRSLSVLELFDILQKEYIVCELRYKIYPIPDLKKYWQELMEKKKERIFDILNDNNKHKLISIFDSEVVRKNYEDKIIPDMGFPNFIYRDDFQRLKLEKWDIHNYYLPESEVRVYINGGGEEIGLIKWVDLRQQLARVELNNGVVKNFNIKLLTRIL